MGPMAVPEAKNTKYCIPVKTRALHNSSVPRLSGWSFQQPIHRGVLLTPHCPDKSGPAVSSTEKLRKDSTPLSGREDLHPFWKTYGLEAEPEATGHFRKLYPLCSE